tara:strand:+ start:1052 stop:2041 length:990 start_codon:yes stop_codon:yes gene_type:complete
MSAVDEYYIDKVSYRLEKFKKVRDGLYNFRCPYCGDSKKHRNKARGYFFVMKQRMVYKCHNCGIGRTAPNFLKDIAPELYAEYQIEKYRQGRTGKGTTTKKLEVPDSTPYFAKKTIDLTSIDSLNNGHPAKEYLLSRKIPDLSRFYYVSKFKEWVNTQKPRTFDNLQNDRPRIIIPLLRHDGTMFGIQGRSLEANPSLRYISIMFEDQPKIFGLDKINTDETIYITEGPFDSTFVENSVAMCGSDIDIRTFGWSDYIWVFDNEPRNKQIVNRISTAIDRGDKVVIWDKSIKEKDINEMVLQGYDPYAIIKHNTFSGLQAKLKLADWKKV